MLFKCFHIAPAHVGDMEEIQGTVIAFFLAVNILAVGVVFDGTLVTPYLSAYLINDSWNLISCIILVIAEDLLFGIFVLW